MPAGVAAHLNGRTAAQFQNGPHPLDHHTLLTGNAGPDGQSKPQAVLFHTHDPQIQGSLHQSGKIHIHRLNPLGQSQQSVEHPGSIFLGEGVL